MKKLLALALPAIFLLSCNPTSDPEPSVPVDDYSTKIVGKWKVESVICHYDPTAGGAEKTYDVTAYDEFINLDFKADKTVQELDATTGEVYAIYDYSITEDQLKLTDKSNSEVYNMTILTLNNETLKTRTNDGAGGELKDDDHNLLGTIKYNIATYKKL